MTTIELFCNLKDNLPLVLDENELFHKGLDCEYKRYMLYLKRLDKQEFYDFLGHPLDELIREEEDIIKSLKEVIYEVRNGDAPTAYTKINNLLNKKIGDKILIKHHKTYKSQENTFYRIIGKPDGEINKTYAYHRNFKDAAYIPNYRFSMNGFPCLYLGSSRDVCEKESEGNNETRILNTYQISNGQTITFLSIAPPITDRHKEELYNFFLLYPLYLASLTQYKEPSKKYFHEEYIIPQLLLLYVRKNQTKIDGIRYLSTYYRKDDDIQKMLDYVLPVTGIKDEGFDMKLMDKFEIKEQKEI